MLTILTFDELPLKSTLKEKLLYKFKKSVTVSETEYNDIPIKKITVTKKRNKIPWKKISHNIPSETQNILSSKEIDFPDHFKFKRYESTNLNRIFCKNAVVETLNRADIPPNKLDIVLFDPLGIHYEIIPRILLYSNRIKVITKNIEFYSRESEILMEQYGISILISDSMSWLRPCHVLIAPDKITVPISLPKSCIIFTGYKPSIFLNGTVYYDYKIGNSTNLNEILPYDISPEYFLGAVFDHSNMINIDTITPKMCISDNETKKLTEISKKLYSIINRS